MKELLIKIAKNLVAPPAKGTDSRSDNDKKKESDKKQQLTKRTEHR